MKKILFLFLLYIGINAISFSQNGSKVKVLWNSSWFPATVIESKESSWKIHYDNYGSEWDEWVGSDRIKFEWNKGDIIQVLWNDKWFKAQILEVGNGKYKIHYDGYGSEWDEWVTLNRMKK